MRRSSEIVDKLTMIGLEVEQRRGQGQGARALCHRQRGRGQAASQRRPAARLHGRHRPRRAGPGGVRRAECAHRHEGRVRAARRVHSRQEHDARRSAPSAASKAAACWCPSSSCKSPTTTKASSICRRTRRSARATRKYAGLDDPVIEINLTPNRPDCTGVNGIARDLAAADMGTFKERDAEAGEGRVPLPGLGDARFRRRRRRSARRSRCGWCAASRTARRRTGCRSG